MGTIKRTLVKDAYPELEEWFVDKEIFNTCYIGSVKKAIFKCPDCGNIETVKICNFIKRVYKCLNCKQDGISRPNKFLREFLKEVES